MSKPDESEMIDASAAGLNGMKALKTELSPRAKARLQSPAVPPSTPEVEESDEARPPKGTGKIARG